MADKSICFPKKGALIGALLLSCLLAVPALSFRMGEFANLDRERFLFVPPARYLEALRGNFRNFLADAYYIRGILSLTDDFSSNDYRVYWVQEHCRAAVVLDPEMIQAFFFGGMVVANNEQTTRQGIAFLEEGLKIAPGKWEIPYWLGFNHYTLGEHLEAAQFYRAASVLPDAPKFLRSNQAMLYYKAGRPELGLMYLEGLLETVRDPKQLEWIELKIKWLKGVFALEAAVQEFKSRFERAPENLEELVSERLIDSVPEDPFGGGYYFDAGTKRVMSRFGGSVSRRVGEPVEPGGCTSCKK